MVFFFLPILLQIRSWNSVFGIYWSMIEMNTMEIELEMYDEILYVAKLWTNVWPLYFLFSV